MACVDPKSKILQQEHIDKINKEHENLFVEGISFSEQRAIVKSISSMLYRQALEKDTTEDKLDVRDTKEQILNYLISETKNLQGLIDFYKDLGTPVAEQMLFNIQQTLEKFEAIESNLDTLVRHAQTILKSLAGMKFTEHDESLDFTAIVDDDIDGDSTEEDSEGITRTSFYENFYFQLNPKDTAQNKLKKFLSFINGSSLMIK
jgi:hypothetical protein